MATLKSPAPLCNPGFNKKIVWPANSSSDHSELSSSPNTNSQVIKKSGLVGFTDNGHAGHIFHGQDLSVKMNLCPSVNYFVRKNSMY
jgi:hypothetical protein